MAGDRPRSALAPQVARAKVILDAMLRARTAEDFRSAVRLHDRMLLSGYYVVPLYHLGEQWVARSKHIGRPETVPLYGFQFPVWWDERAQ